MIRQVKSGQDLQKAIDEASGGDTIALEPGARFVGTFYLTPKTSEVILMSAGDLPERRIEPDDYLPILESGSTEPVLIGENTRNWKIDGIEFLPNEQGHETLIVLQNAENTHFDRILFEANDAIGQKRAILGNGRNIKLTRSHLARIWTPGADSQCFAAWDGAGPYLIQDNYLEAASENVLFGGADSSSEANIPSDIIIEDNFFTKPIEWKGQQRVVKNLLELKCAKRVTIQNNSFEHCWTDGQTGYAILFTVRNQDGRAPWSVLEDILFEGNWISGCQNGISISGTDDERPSAQSSLLVIRNNVIEVDDWQMMIGNEWMDLTFENNTGKYRGVPCMLSGWKIWVAGDEAPRLVQFAVKDFTFKNNCGYMNDYGFFGDGKPWNEFVAGSLDMTNNAMANNVSNQQLPGTNWYPSSQEHEANFDSEYVLMPDSTYNTMATDGKELGCRFEDEDIPEPTDLEERVSNIEADLEDLRNTLRMWIDK